MTLRHLLVLAPISLIASIANAQIVSVNFHVGDDAAGQADHIFDGVETAGAAGSNTAAWNNISVGNGGSNAAAAQIFAPAILSDDSGNATAATITSTLTSGTDSTWFIGYAASAASAEEELGNGGTDVNLFGSSWNLVARFRNAEDLLRFVDERINHRTLQDASWTRRIVVRRFCQL